MVYRVYKNKRLQPQITIVDESGFYKNGLIEFSRLINVRPPLFIEPNIILPSTKITSSLPNSINQFANEKIYPQWRQEHSTYRISCSHFTEKEFNFNMKCPAVVSKLNSDITKYPIKVVIHSKNVQGVMPSRFAGQDQYLSALINKDTVIIKNLANNFINLDSFSVYYKSKIATLSSLQVDLPPQSEHRISLRDFLHLLPSTFRKEYTTKLASKEQIDFGFAAKYKIMDLNIEKTLFKKNNFSGVDLAEY